MEPKEIRRKILQAIYDSDDRDFFRLESFKYQRTLIGDKELNQEIRYLEGKGYLKIIDETMSGSSYINYSVLAITSQGIDLIENPEMLEIHKPVEINHFENISDSNINIKSPSSTQSISKQEISPEIYDILFKLKNSIKKKDEKTSLTILKTIGAISKEILIGIITSGIDTFMKTHGIKI